MTPRTRAGKALLTVLQEYDEDGHPNANGYIKRRAADDIAEAEAEARAALLADLTRQIEGLAGMEPGYHPELRKGFEYGRRAVLKVLRDAEGERRGSEPPLPGTWPELRDA